MLMIVTGLLMIVVAALTGEVEFALFLIFPIIYGTGILAIGGILLIFGGILLTFFSVLPGVPGVGETADGGRVRGGGVVLVGPVPIVFGSDWNMALLAIVLTIVLVVVVFLLLL